MSSLPCPEHLRTLAFQGLCVLHDTTTEVMRETLSGDDDLALKSAAQLHQLEQLLVIAYERGQTGATR